MDRAQLRTFVLEHATSPSGDIAAEFDRWPEALASLFNLGTTVTISRGWKGGGIGQAIERDFYLEFDDPHLALDFVTAACDLFGVRAFPLGVRDW